MGVYGLWLNHKPWFMANRLCLQHTLASRSFVSFAVKFFKYKILNLIWGIYDISYMRKIQLKKPRKLQNSNDEIDSLGGGSGAIGQWSQAGMFKSHCRYEETEF